MVAENQDLFPSRPALALKTLPIALHVPHLETKPLQQATVRGHLACGSTPARRRFMGGQTEKKWFLLIFFEGLGAKFRRARQCDGRGTPDIQAPDLEFSGVPATEIAHFRLIS